MHDFSFTTTHGILYRGNETPLSRETCMQEKVELEQREERVGENRRAIPGWLILTSRKRTHPQKYK
jgi:predicted dithiol-disulfide oxidoreductase (DUF899 family)